MKKRMRSMRRMSTNTCAIDMSATTCCSIRSLPELGGENSESHCLITLAPKGNRSPTGVPGYPWAS